MSNLNWTHSTGLWSQGVSARSLMTLYLWGTVFLTSYLFCLYVTQTPIACPLQSRCGAPCFRTHMDSGLYDLHWERCSHPLYRWRQNLRKVKSCAPGCLRLKLKPQLSLASKTRLLPCSCPVPFTRLMTVGSFLTHTLFLLTHTSAYSFLLVPVSFLLPRRSLRTLHRERPEASHFPRGGRHLS